MKLPTLPGRSWVILTLGTVATVAAGVLLFGAEGDALPQAAETALPVTVRPVAHLGRPNYVALSGDVEAWRSANVGFMVPGLVVSVGPREGDVVRAGQILAELDPRDYELNLEMAAAQRERAEDEHRRAEALFAQKAVPENDFHKAATALRLARAQEAMAAKKLADSKIAAPMSGILARRGVEPGEQAGPGFPVFTLMQIDPVQVRVGVPEAEIARVQPGQRAVVTIPSLGRASFEGRVRLVGIAADPASRTYLVKVEVANSDGQIRPGMIAEVRVETDSRVEALTLPAEAVVRDVDGITRVFVYNPEEERVYARRVGVGTAYGQEIEIREGLAGDELVVIGGQHRVREGAHVQARVETGSLVQVDGRYRFPEEPLTQAVPAVAARDGGTP